MDFGKVISAAAVSTLGVLSLIIVALGLLAFQFFKGSPEKTKLTVWWTALVAGGLFAAAFITQADRTKTSEPRETGTPVPDDTPKPRTTATPASGSGTEPQPVVTPTAVAAPAARPSSPVTPMPTSEPTPTDISGQWRDDDGYTYLITVSGNMVAFQQWLNGMAAGYGQGSINGRNLRYGFVTADGNQGNCMATAATGNRRITGTCTSGTGTWPFTIER